MKKRDDAVYLHHILESVKLIEQFIEGIDMGDFIDNKMIHSAVIRQLEIIGEASRLISDDLKNKYTAIPWRIMSDMRNVLIHEYFGVDLAAVWDTVKNDIPRLKHDINEIIKSEEKYENNITRKS